MGIKRWSLFPGEIGLITSKIFYFSQCFISIKEQGENAVQVEGHQTGAEPPSFWLLGLLWLCLLLGGQGQYKEWGL